VDMCIVGTDRTTRQGDVANKIGTYLKALAAHDNHIPFYVALPSTTLDMTICDGLKEIPIEQRDQNEVRYIVGKSKVSGQLDEVLICPETTEASNYGFDVTPARLVTALITERGVCDASEAGLTHLFPEYK
jgi:methylthioribose-1-phosphate isomerase